MVTDNRGHHQILLPVQETNLKALTVIIVNQFIQPTWGLYYFTAWRYIDSLGIGHAGSNSWKQLCPSLAWHDDLGIELRSSP